MSLERFNLVARPFMQEETAELQNVLARVYRGPVHLLVVALPRTAEGFKASVVNTFGEDPTVLMDIGNLLVSHAKNITLRSPQGTSEMNLDMEPSDDII